MYIYDAENKESECTKSENLESGHMVAENTKSESTKSENTKSEVTNAENKESENNMTENMESEKSDNTKSENKGSVNTEPVSLPVACEKSENTQVEVMEPENTKSVHYEPESIEPEQLANTMADRVVVVTISVHMKAENVEYENKNAENMKPNTVVVSQCPHNYTPKAAIQYKVPRTSKLPSSTCRDTSILRQHCRCRPCGGLQPVQLPPQATGRRCGAMF